MRLHDIAVPSRGATTYRRGLTLATAALLAAAGLSGVSTAEAATARHDVVVTGASADGAAQAVRAAGGEVIAALPVTGGVAARLPQGATLGPQWLIAPQRELRVASGGVTAAAGAATTVRQMLGLRPDGNEGRGVTVAVVDTGIADVPDLARRVSGRVDLSGDGAGDGYGHGTFMAGLIAASGAASGGAHRGVAPAADLIDVKVADAQGRTDLITVLRGLQWVSDHAKDVQVVNLSLSSDSPLPYQIDPLNQALQALWHRGITVVVPSGNDGPGTGSVTAPGNDPVLLTAGGLDTRSTADRRDDVVGDWSGRGPTRQGDAKPDLVAAGGHVVSLRSPGSVVDTANPQARIGADYLRGSGTSMAAAVTSGVVAAALAEQPRLKPDAVKNLLVGTAYRAQGLSRAAGGGAGGLDAVRAVANAPRWSNGAAQHRYDQDTRNVARDAKRWAAFSAAVADGDRAAIEKAWAKLSRDSRDWAARAWADLDPAARAWAARAWAARAWAGADSAWVARAWAARAWAARAWAARAWAGDQWTARAWADSDWAARAWAARAWAGDDWAARAWAADRWSARAWAWLPLS